MRLRNFAVRRQETAHHGWDAQSTASITDAPFDMCQAARPAFPSLLRATSQGHLPMCNPAAFPSKPLTGPLDSLMDRVETATYETPTDHVRNDSMSGWGEIHGVNSHGSLDNITLHDCRDELPADKIETLVDMQISPERQSEISWSSLDDSLQLYIFENLLPRLKNVERIGQVLGLSTTDLAHLIHLRNIRHNHPSSTAELWDHCLGLNSEKTNFVDPKTLNHYMQYFHFAANLEEASLEQRRRAKALLGQRRVEGPFVDCLIHEPRGLWLRPNTEPCGHTASNHQAVINQHQTSTHDITEPSGFNMLGDPMKVVDDDYFPEAEGHDLLRKDITKTHPFEDWLTNGTAMGQNEVSPQASADAALSSARLHPIIRSLCSLFAARSQLQPQQGPSLFGMSSLLLYAVTRSQSELKIIRAKISGLPLSLAARQSVLEAAKYQVMSMISMDLKLVLRKSQARMTLGSICVPPVQPIASKPRDIHESMSLTEGALPTVSSSFNATSLERSSPEPSPHSNQATGRSHRSESRCTDATLDTCGMPSKYERVKGPCRGEGPCKVDGGYDAVLAAQSQLSSEEESSPSASLHATRNGDEDTTTATLPSAGQRGGKRSPVQPYWSPFTNDEIETDSFPSPEPSKPVILRSPGRCASRSFRGTPWRSGKSRGRNKRDMQSHTLPYNIPSESHKSGDPTRPRQQGGRNPRPAPPRVTSRQTGYFQVSRDSPIRLRTNTLPAGAPPTWRLRDARTITGVPESPQPELTSIAHASGQVINSANSTSTPFSCPQTPMCRNLIPANSPPAQFGKVQPLEYAQHIIGNSRSPPEPVPAKANATLTSPLRAKLGAFNSPQESKSCVGKTGKKTRACVMEKTRADFQARALSETHEEQPVYAPQEMLSAVKTL